MALEIWIVTQNIVTRPRSDWAVEDVLRDASIKLGIDIDITYTTFDKITETAVLPNGYCIIDYSLENEPKLFRGTVLAQRPVLAATFQPNRLAEWLTEEDRVAIYPLGPDAADTEDTGSNYEDVRRYHAELFLRAVAAEAGEDGYVQDIYSYFNRHGFFQRRGPNPLDSESHVRQASENTQEESLSIPGSIGEVTLEATAELGPLPVANQIVKRLRSYPEFSADILSSAAQLIDEFVADYLHRTGQNTLPDDFGAIMDISGSYARISDLLQQRDDSIEALKGELERLLNQVDKLTSALLVTLESNDSTTNSKSRRDLMREGFYRGVGGMGSNILMFSIGAAASYVFAEANSMINFQNALAQIKAQLSK